MLVEVVTRTLYALLQNYERRLLASVMSVRPSAWNNSPPTGRIFLKFWYSRIFRKSVDKIQVSLNSDTNTEYFTVRLISIFYLFRQSIIKVRLVPGEILEKNETHFLSGNIFFETRAFYEKVEKYYTGTESLRWKYSVWALHADCLRLHTQCVILIASALQQWLQKSASVLS